MKKIIGTVILIATFQFTLLAQDMHFSQFYLAPLTQNPGNTGSFNGTIRAYTLYRMQWFTVTKPYRTFTINLDGAILKKKLKRIDFFAAGLNINNDNQGGTAHVKTTSYNALISFTKFLGGRQKHNITLGYELGYATKTAALGALTWDNQWDGTNYNAAYASGEPGAGARGFLDMSTGIVWNFTTNHLFRSALGFSFQHFTAPNVSLEGRREKLYPRLGAQLNMNYRLSEGSNTTLEPSFMFAHQGTTMLLNAGLSIKYVLSDHSHYTDNRQDKALHLGIYYRLKDAMFVAVRFDYGAFNFSLAYDVNLSPLTPTSHSVGGFELAILYKGIFGSRRESQRASLRFL